jgi:enoyl-CoA hydratase/carnithine racemase
MEIILTGSTATASEMERFGIVNKVSTTEEDVVEEALKVAEAIAAFSVPAIGLAKQAVKAGKHSIATPTPEKGTDMRSRGNNAAYRVGNRAVVVL